jgi:hypothetical protein
MRAFRRATRRLAA